jgi:hypothetical protein
VQIEAPDLLPQRLELRAESPATDMEKLELGPDIEVGDRRFDDAVLVRGHPVLAVALLDATNRERVMDMVLKGCRVQEGCMLLTLPDYISSEDEFTSTVGGLLEAVRALCAPTDPAPLLAYNALHDPLPDVRQRNLELLRERFPHRPDTAQVLRQAMTDSAREVRLTAAAGLGDEGLVVLEELVADADASDDIVAGAILALGTRFGEERALEMLGQALRGRNRPVALATIAVLGKTGGEAAVSRLRTVLGAGNDELAAAAASALGESSDPGAEPPLLAALDHDSGEVRVAAAEALGRMGGVAAVPGLHRAVAAWPYDQELRDVALAAITRIQGRATGASVGQLTLAEGEAGDLALTEEEGGELSLSDHNEGLGQGGRE